MRRGALWAGASAKTWVLCWMGRGRWKERESAMVMEGKERVLQGQGRLSDMNVRWKRPRGMAEL